MNRSDFSRPEPSSPGKFAAIDQSAFSQLYDQYAPALLGIISTIVGDEAEAVRTLEATFVQVQLTFEQSRSQPLFVWLLSVARATAVEAVKSPKKSGPPILRFTDAGNRSLSIKSGFVTPATESRPSPLNELLDAVLFKNCTPEEAAFVVGLPVPTARQHLRMAMQQWRTSGA